MSYHIWGQAVWGLWKAEAIVLLSESVGGNDHLVLVNPSRAGNSPNSPSESNAVIIEQVIIEAGDIVRGWSNRQG